MSPSGYIHCTKWPFFPDDHDGRQYENAMEKNKNGTFCLITIPISRAWEREECCRKVTVLELKKSKFNPILQPDAFTAFRTSTRGTAFPSHLTFFIIIFFCGRKLWTPCVLQSGTASLAASLIVSNKWVWVWGCWGLLPGFYRLARWNIIHPAAPQASQSCSFCGNKWSLVTVREDYYNLIIGLAPMVHSVLLRDVKEHNPYPLETAIQMRREKIGNPQRRKWKSLQTQGHLSVYFNNDKVAAVFPAKVKICAFQRSEAKELCTFPAKLIFNLPRLHLSQWNCSLFEYSLQPLEGKELQCRGALWEWLQNWGRRSTEHH